MNKTTVFYPFSRDDISQSMLKRIQHFADQITEIFPLQTHSSFQGEPDNLLDSIYVLREPKINSHTLESFPGKFSRVEMPLIAVPQYCDLDTVIGHPERLLFEISPVDMVMYESHLIKRLENTPRFKVFGIPIGKRQVLKYNKMERIEVGRHHFMISELIYGDIPHDIALQATYRLTFASSTFCSKKTEWSTHGFLIPYSIAKHALELFSLGPICAFHVFKSLLIKDPVDTSLIETLFKIRSGITHIGGTVIMNEHRTSFRGEISPTSEPILTSPVYYYGTSRGGGFSLHTPNKKSINNGTLESYPEIAELENLMKKDGISHSVFTARERLPQGKFSHGTPDGQARLHYINGWTCLAICDSLYDGRPGSSSTFFTQGVWDFDVMCKISRNAYPDIWNRFDQCGIKIVLIS